MLQAWINSCGLKKRANGKVAGVMKSKSRSYEHWMNGTLWMRSGKITEQQSHSVCKRTEVDSLKPWRAKQAGEILPREGLDWCCALGCV